MVGLVTVGIAFTRYVRLLRCRHGMNVRTSTKYWAGLVEYVRWHGTSSDYGDVLSGLRR